MTPFAPEQLALLVARFVTDGLPAPISLSFYNNHILVDLTDLPEWCRQAAVVDGEWEPTSDGHGEIFTGHATGYTLTAWRPHQCAPTP